MELFVMFFSDLKSWSFSRRLLETVYRSSSSLKCSKRGELRCPFFFFFLENWTCLFTWALRCVVTFEVLLDHGGSHMLFWFPCCRYHRSISVSELYRMRDTIEIEEHGGAGRMMSLVSSPSPSPKNCDVLDLEVYSAGRVRSPQYPFYFFCYFCEVFQL